MSVPLKNRLSYLFAKACGQDRLYSRVFAETDSYEVTRMNNIHIFFPGAASSNNVPLTYRDVERVNYSTWLEAHPAAGEKDKFFVYQHEHGRGVNKIYTHENLFNREQIVRMIEKQEQDWRKTGARQEYRQPFAAKFAVK